MVVRPARPLATAIGHLAPTAEPFGVAEPPASAHRGGSCPPCPVHATPPRHRRPARTRLRPAHPVSHRHGLRGRLGVPSQERPHRRVAAMADAAGQPLADAAVVSALGHRHRLDAAGDTHRALCRAALVAVAAAAGVRDVGGGADPTLLRGSDQRPHRARLRRVPAALLADAGLAAGQLCRLAAAHHLEPPVVPGLPVGLHAGTGLADARPGYRCRASRRGALRPCAGAAADRAAQPALVRLGGLARSPLPVHQPAVRRLVPARQIRHGIPGRLPACPRHPVLGARGRAAPDHPVGGSRCGELVLRHPPPGAGVA